MTKEQAIEVLHELDGSLYETQQVALDMAIKALEQQPSEDCVSRQAVLDILSHYAHNFGADNEIKSLSPVTPTRKVGKWVMPDKYFDKNIWRKCSVCNTHFEMYHKYVAINGEVTYIKELANYCKVCGAEMRDSENN